MIHIGKRFRWLGVSRKTRVADDIQRSLQKCADVPDGDGLISGMVGFSSHSSILAIPPSGGSSQSASFLAIFQRSAEGHVFSQTKVR